MLSDDFIAQKQNQSQKILKTLRNIDELLNSQIQNKTKQTENVKSHWKLE